nr:hypothetical protein [Andreprevotia chitinilytica]
MVFPVQAGSYDEAVTPFVPTAGRPTFWNADRPIAELLTPELNCNHVLEAGQQFQYVGDVCIAGGTQILAEQNNKPIFGKNRLGADHHTSEKAIQRRQILYATDAGPLQLAGEFFQLFRIERLGRPSRQPEPQIGNAIPNNQEGAPK